MGTEPDLTKQAADLIRSFDRVDGAVAVLGERVDEHQSLIATSMGLIKTTMDRYRLGLMVVTGSVAVLICFAFLILFLYQQQDQNTQHINDIQQRTSAEILCPLYGIFLNSIEANPVPPNQTQAQLDFRKNAADTIKRGYETLG